MTEQEEIDKLTGGVEFKDVLAAPKARKDVEIDQNRLRADQIEKELKEKANQQRIDDLLGQGEESKNTEIDKTIEVIEDAGEPGLKSDLDQSAESFVNMYEMAIVFLNEYGKKLLKDSLTDEEQYDAAYLNSLAKEDLDETQRRLVGRYLHLKDAQVKFIQENDLSPKELEVAQKAIKTYLKQSGQRVSPINAMMAILGSQAGKRVKNIFWQ